MKLETIATPMVRMALTEDIGGGDITTGTTVAEDLHASAAIFAREGGVLAGLEVARIVFRELDANIEFTPHMKDGENLAAGKRVCTISGNARAVLTGERVALNFLQRLSGVATLTNRFVRRVRGTGVRITDTRKTTPGMRILEKYAVNVGGGASHRFGLFDMYLVKENHIKAAGSISAAVRRIKAKERDIPIEVEAKSYEQVKEACECGVDRILLDNMSLTHINKSVEIINNHRQQTRFRKGQTEEPSKPEIEASGGVTLENVKEIALTGVEYISVGALTHSFSSVDMSLLIEEVGPQATSSGA
ncbi:MAG: hypothetical protein AMJ46_10550 [Latescibacteria bacterium DG_63]|nr:MAG: hypothetical protein AMJ46_10550 [Latescibacteria bacterium DG_63]